MANGKEGGDGKPTDLVKIKLPGHTATATVTRRQYEKVWRNNKYEIVTDDASSDTGGGDNGGDNETTGGDEGGATTTQTGGRRGTKGGES